MRVEEWLWWRKKRWMIHGGLIPTYLLFTPPPSSSPSLSHPLELLSLCVLWIFSSDSLLKSLTSLDLFLSFSTAPSDSLHESPHPRPSSRLSANSPSRVLSSSHPRVSRSLRDRSNSRNHVSKRIFIANTRLTIPALLQSSFSLSRSV